MSYDENVRRQIVDQFKRLSNPEKKLIAFMAEQQQKQREEVKNQILQRREVKLLKRSLPEHIFNDLVEVLIDNDPAEIQKFFKKHCNPEIIAALDKEFDNKSISPEEYEKELDDFEKELDLGEGK